VSDDGLIHEPVDRLTRLCDAMTKTLEGHAEYREDTDKCIILIDDDQRGGLIIHGYDPETATGDAIICLFSHLRAIARTAGYDVDMIAIPDSPEGL
jgi:hypothetical protein